MPHLLFLRLEVGAIRLGGRHLERNPIHDLEPESAQRSVLLGVVGHQPKPSRPQVVEDLGPRAVVPRVRLEAEVEVRVDRVSALILELVGLELVEQPDAPALLEQVEQYAVPLVGDAAKRDLELPSAVAALGSEDVALAAAVTVGFATRSSHRAALWRSAGLLSADAAANYPQGRLAHLAAAVLHVVQGALALGQHRHDRARVLLGHVHDQPLHRLEIALHDDLGLADRELVVLAPQFLHQDADVQGPTA